MEWYRKSAQQGHAPGEYGLSYAYGLGRGVPEDEAEAMRWARKAAAQGDAMAESALGSAYYHGSGVTRDYAQSLTWYRKAAEQGEAGAEYGLCYLYHYAKGVSHNDVTAFRWCYRAAEQGDATAQEIAGHMYRYGEGIAQNAVRAYMWISLAAARAEGEQRERCLRELDLLAPKMSGSQIAEAKRLAAAWKPKSPDSASDTAPGGLAGIAQTYLPRHLTMILGIVLSLLVLLPNRVWKGAVRLPVALTSAALVTFFVHSLLLPEGLVRRLAQGPFWPIYTSFGRVVFLALVACAGIACAYAAVRGPQPDVPLIPGRPGAPGIPPDFSR